MAGRTHLKGVVKVHSQSYSLLGYPYKTTLVGPSDPPSNAEKTHAKREGNPLI